MLVCHGLLPRHLVVTRSAYRRMTSVMPESVQRESMSPFRLAIGVRSQRIRMPSKRRSCAAEARGLRASRDRRASACCRRAACS